MLVKRGACHGRWVFIIKLLKMKNLLIILALLFGSVANAQIFYSPITEMQYNKITSGNAFYEGQVQLTDGNWYKGWVARFPDSNKLRFRSKDDSVRIHVLTDKYVKAFCYNLNDTIPLFVFREVPVTKRKTKKIALELITTGDINLYVHKWVEQPETPFLPFSKAYYQMLLEFYIEKDGVFLDVRDFEYDLARFINDKEEVFNQYKATKKERRKNDGNYRYYINTIIKYNETE